MRDGVNETDTGNENSEPASVPCPLDPVMGPQETFVKGQTRVLLWIEEIDGGITVSRRFPQAGEGMKCGMMRR